LENSEFWQYLPNLATLGPYALFWWMRASTKKFLLKIQLCLQLEMARAAIGPDLGWPLTIFLAVWFYRVATRRPLMLKKLHFFELKEPVGGNKSEWNHLASSWHIFRCWIFRQICFSNMWALCQARLAASSQRCAWTGFWIVWNRTPAASSRIRIQVFLTGFSWCTHRLFSWLGDMAVVEFALYPQHEASCDSQIQTGKDFKNKFRKQLESSSTTSLNKWRQRRNIGVSKVMNWTQEEWRRILDLQTLDLQGRCIVYLLELSYIYTPFAIASHH